MVKTLTMDRRTYQLLEAAALLKAIYSRLSNASSKVESADDLETADLIKIKNCPTHNTRFYAGFKC